MTVKARCVGLVISLSAICTLHVELVAMSCVSRRQGMPGACQRGSRLEGMAETGRQGTRGPAVVKDGQKSQYGTCRMTGFLENRSTSPQPSVEQRAVLPKKDR